jgi:hypothetical protein
MKTTIVFLTALFAFSASAQTTNEVAPRLLAGSSAGILLVKDPKPVCITPQVSQAVSTSQTVPVATLLPQVTPVFVKAFCLQSNGVDTAFRIEPSDPANTAVVAYLKTDGAGKDSRYTANIRVPSQNFDSVFAGFNYSLSADYGGVWLNSYSNGGSHYANNFASTKDGVWTFSFPNDELGSEGRPAQIGFYVWDRRDGQVKDSFPAVGGYVTVPTTLSVSMSPTTSTTVYRYPGQVSPFQLVAEVSSTLAPGQVSFTWLADGRDNVTDLFNGQAVHGSIATVVPTSTPILQRFTRRINYDANNIHPGTKLRVTVYSSEGIAYDEVVYNVETILESGNLPPIR